MFSLLVFYGIIGTIFCGMLRSRRFQEANILSATAESLALIRIISALVTLFYMVGENYSSLASVPAELATPRYPVSWLLQIPFFADAHRNPAFLQLLTWTSAAALVCTAIGWQTRASALIGGFGSLLLGGIARQYTGFGHQGLISLEVVVALAFTPCADAFSFDARRKLVRHTPEIYGWSRMACWCLTALPYLNAALSKVRNGNLDWLHADNLRAWLYMDNLLEKGFNFDGGLLIASAPDGVFSTLAGLCVAIEFSALLLLFLPLARRFVPWLLIAMHVGILWFHNVAFFDLMVMPLIFVDWSNATARLAITPPPPLPASARGTQILTLLCALFVLIPWKHHLEYFPLTGWKMYSAARLEGTTDYQTIRAVLASGQEVPFDPGSAIAILHQGYHRRMIAMIFDEKKKPACARLLARCAEIHNRKASPADQINGFIVTSKNWNFRDYPNDPAFGSVQNSVRISTLPPNP